MLIEVIAKNRGNELRAVKYTFWLRENLTMYLDKMMVVEKATKRHGFKLMDTESYSRIDSRSYGIKEEPDVDMEIQLEAIRMAKELIKVERWKS